MCCWLTGNGTEPSASFNPTDSGALEEMDEHHGDALCGRALPD